MDETQIITTATIAWMGAAIGVVFGLAGNRSNFCTMGAVADIVNMGSWTRMRMWLFAIGIAVLGTGALQLSGYINVANTSYTGPNLVWLSNIVGGLIFGVGMTLAGGCGAKTLIRLGGGSLKALIVVTFTAIAAYMTMRGLFGVWRVSYLNPVALALPTNQDIPSLVAHSMGMTKTTALMLMMAVVGGGASVFALAGRDFRRPEPLLGALVIGLVIVAGWYVTGHLGYLAEHPMTLEEAFIGTNSGRAESLSFMGPYAYTLELLMLWTDASRVVTFGIATALGAVVGSALAAIASGSFRIETFRDSTDLTRHLVGAMLMGFGGVTAMGCTIGQALTGVSTLAVGSFLTFIAIVAGCAATVQWEYWRAMRDD
jgi:uncharacterized protein